MACRIQNLKPPCAYNLGGLSSIHLLDFDDFKGFRFEDDKLSNTSYVSAILRIGDFTVLDAPDGAKYSSTLNNKIYTHTLETFIGDLSAQTSSNLHLAKKRRYVPVFKLKSGKYFTFGYDAGATLSYTNQTSEVTGALVTLTAQSIYPLFQAGENAMNASTAEWILEDGIWNYFGEYWFNNGIWNY